MTNATHRTVKPAENSLDNLFLVNSTSANKGEPMQDKNSVFSDTFQSVRNFFRDVFFGKDEFPDVMWHNESRLHIVHEDETLTAAELQMLQRIMAQHIRTHEQVRKEFKEEALSYPVGDEMRNMLFREHREIKAKLKSLSALQYRLKHKIAARG